MKRLLGLLLNGALVSAWTSATKEWFTVDDARRINWLRGITPKLEIRCHHDTRIFLNSFSSGSPSASIILLAC
mgnify:CR=1 FL=1